MNLRQVNECFFIGDYQGSFEALRILYSDLLKKPRKEMEKDWTKFVAEKNGISVNEGSFAKRNLKLRDRQNNYLYVHIPEIKARFIEVLEKHKLLDMDISAKPKYRKKAKLTVPQH